MFSKNRAPSRPAGNSPVAGSTFSVFGADIRITGDVAASADLHVDGRIEGDVTCTSLVQGEASEIVGAVRAETARLAGVIRGTISVRDLVVLKSARIHGDVHYDSLTIEQGAQVEGRFAPRGANDPSVAAGVEALLVAAE
ncbi:MAG: polymer-forming cytoskeletal protein [Novosphingobium sp.]|nr:polymer-forming cytoskeletal protein [Novosphingobium sp.]MDP3906225.1 polymer-forming cytoskeletal protein [Novosphingobium sp.]